MNSELENRTARAAEKFGIQVLQQVYKPEYKIPISQGIFKNVVVSRKQIEHSLRMLSSGLGK